jgi:phytoene dehydrogenase-like protein
MSPGRSVRELEGRVGLPMPVAQLAARGWDAVVVGGGHNGLTAAAYLARAGRSVLVLERREQLGGACTIERPFADERYLVSPCAYVVGLLDELVVSELALRRHGYRVTPCDPHLWCGFADGSSYADFADPATTATYLREQGFAESDITGLDAYHRLIARARAALRGGPEGDSWVGRSPTRDEIERRLGGDEELIGLLFEDSIAAVIERHVADPRLHQALWGQGVIGTDAGPRTPGTAAVKLMHSQGTLEGAAGAWGYVRGGMGTVSFAIADAALEAGAALAAGVPVARILPGEGVQLESGELIRARAVLSNADPKRLRSMLPAADVPAAFAARLDRWRTSSPVAKLNAGLTRMPSFAAAPEGVRPERAMVTVALPLEDGQAAWEASRSGEIRIGFCELYFHSAYDPSVAPAGRQTMSVFAQYVPQGSSGAEAGDEQGAPMADAILDLLATSAPDVRDCVEFVEVLGPAEIEQRIGLSGGHIFQGSTLPDQMWEHRFDHRTPIDGLYMCGAATHPAGSVIALNGRNAAMAAIGDLERAPSLS